MQKSKGTGEAHRRATDKQLDAMGRHRKRNAVALHPIISESGHQPLIVDDFEATFRNFQSRIPHLPALSFSKADLIERSYAQLRC